MHDLGIDILRIQLNITPELMPENLPVGKSTFQIVPSGTYHYLKRCPRSLTSHGDTRAHWVEISKRLRLTDMTAFMIGHAQNINGMVAYFPSKFNYGWYILSKLDPCPIFMICVSWRRCHMMYRFSFPYKAGDSFEEIIHIVISCYLNVINHITIQSQPLQSIRSCHLKQ